MKLIAAKKDLVKLAARMQGVAERKSTMPVLANVLLQTEGQALRLSATDLYLSISGTVPAEVRTEGSAAIPAKDFFERLKMMPDGPIEIEADDKGATKLHAKGTARRYTLRGMPGSDFPPMPRPSEDAPRLALEARTLAALMASTHYAISTDETRAHLNSALFEWDGPVLRMVTTDGHRLAKREVKVTGRSASETMLLPQKAITELRRLCEDATAPAGDDKAAPSIQIVRNGASAFFETGGLLFGSKVVDAVFPPYAQVIPTSTTHDVRVPRALFADALRAVSVAASAQTGGVKLTLKKGFLEIRSESPDSGDANDEVPVEYRGADLLIGVNAKYILDALGAIEEEEFRLGVSGELDPIVVRPGKDESFIAVVMPMRV